MIAEEWMVRHVWKTYLEHFRDHTVKTIFDVGARDCAQSVQLATMWPEATVVAFEPNPDTFPECYQNAQKRPNIQLVKEAVSEVDGPVTFYRSLTENHGYSSLYKPSGLYDSVEPMPTEPITVDSIRLDTFMTRNNIKTPAIVWCDAQGGDLGVFKSMGRRLRFVKLIWTEYLLDKMYDDVPLFDDLDKFLTESGFACQYKGDVPFNGKYWFGNACYVRTE